MTTAVGTEPGRYEIDLDRILKKFAIDCSPVVIQGLIRVGSR
jgi:hypothetical protein